MVKVLYRIMQQAAKPPKALSHGKNYRVKNKILHDNLAKKSLLSSESFFQVKTLERVNHIAISQNVLPSH